MQIEIRIGRQNIVTGFAKPSFVWLVCYTDCVYLKKMIFFLSITLVFAQHSHLCDDYEGDLLP